MDKKLNKFKKRQFKKDKENKQEKYCPYCNKAMKYKGPKDGFGTIYWKCRNKKCGRTVELRADPPKEVIPLIYIKKVLHGRFL